MEIKTHLKIDAGLCGRAVDVGEGSSRVEFEAVERMAADEMGLTHGGFVFGAADYAAMIAVNHPNVVLGGAEVKFLKPVKTGDLLVAEARVEETAGKKQVVAVSVSRDDETVFAGTFVCFVLDAHVLTAA